LVSAPSAKSAIRQGTRSARIQGDDIVLSRREFVQNVAGNTAALTLASLPLSPESFAWASQYSRLFETYLFEALEFEYIPTSASTNTGSVLLVPEYDPADVHVAAEGKLEIANMKDAKIGQPWSQFVCTLTVADLNKRKSLYTGAAGTTDESLRMHYAGNLIIAVGTNVANADIGELWVRYRIRFKTPHLRGVKSGEAATGSSARCAGTVNSAPFGTTYAEGSIPASYASTGTTTSVTTFTFTIPWSGYLVINLGGTGLTSIAPSGTGDEAEIWELENAGATVAVAFYWIDVDQGETFIVTIGNTTIDSNVSIFVQGADRRV
jgi:hypothetical protein